MREQTKGLGLLLVYFVFAGAPASAQSGKKPPAEVPMPAARAATEEEVERLRREVADLRATVQQLVQASSKGTPDAAHLVLAGAASNPAQSDDVSTTEATLPELGAPLGESSSPQKAVSDTLPIIPGWNNEHFYLKSSDGDFTLTPIGYFNAQYNSYKGDGAPPATFTIPRARFGVQGSYGKQVDYQFLFESAAPLTIRDAYIDFKPWRAFSIMGGQYRVPFARESQIVETNFEFNALSIASVLYPNVLGAFRAPGIDVHGELGGGRAQYWVGVFNGQGLLASGTTNEPEIVGKVRFSPWKESGNPWLNGLSLGGSVDHSRSKGLASELSFTGLMTDNSYNFFPQFRINGGIQRYNGFFSWLKGPLGVHGEYTQVLEKRTGIGSFVPGGVGFNSLPGVTGKGAYGMVTYLLTGETQPDNSMPRVRHPVIGPNSPGESSGPGWGAWQLKFRYSWLEGKAPGGNCDASTIPACPITPGIVPTFSDHTRQITTGFNWYLNYWVLVRSDLNFDQLQNPSVQGILPRNYFVFLEGIQFRF
jgi:Phosphate-selective porin O and P